ncbi:MAG: ABC transporter ATP-binding protein [bacterium]|nr:ABC transporter ATP-binding protein [bacterium]
MYSAFLVGHCERDSVSGEGGLELVDLTVSYPEAPRPAVDSLDLVIEPGELVCLLGPSGCGKTTILKAIAGLLELAGGDVRMDGRSLVEVPTEKRSIGMVFQKPLLFPHLTVGENVAFGLRMRRLDPGFIRGRVTEMLGLVQLEGMEDRRVTEISGGQSQRVALARALVVEPALWLLDEPLSQLDANLREEMRELIRSIQKQLGVTTIFVTHDQEEAVVLADRIGLVLEGRLRQIGPPARLFEAPATVEVARFFGGHNQIPGKVDAGRFHCELGTFVLPQPVPPGPGILVIREEAVELAAGENSFAARVQNTRYMGTHQQITMSARGVVLGMRVSSSRSLPVGKIVDMCFPSDRIWIIPGLDG